jgi:hypothetical protein
MDEKEKNQLAHTKSNVLKKCMKNLIRKRSFVDDTDFNAQDDLFDADKKFATKTFNF